MTHFTAFFNILNLQHRTILLTMLLLRSHDDIIKISANPYEIKFLKKHYMIKISKCYLNTQVHVLHWEKIRYFHIFSSQRGFDLKKKSVMFQAQADQR